MTPPISSNFLDSSCEPPRGDITPFSKDKWQSFLEENLGARGFALVAINYRSPRGRPVMEIILENEDGRSITLDQCVQAHQAILVFAQLFSQVEKYSIEVASPGLDRPLVKEADFRRFVGERVSLSFRDALGEKKRVVARLEEVVSEGIQIGGQEVIPWEKIKTCRLSPDIPSGEEKAPLRKKSKRKK